MMKKRTNVWSSTPEWLAVAKLRMSGVVEGEHEFRNDAAPSQRRR